MTPKLLLLVTSDPRTSHRPAEAVRIAAGVGAWKKVQISIYLRGPAVLALGEWVDELVDEDNFTRYLPIIGEFGRPVYVDQSNPFLAGLGTPTLKLAELAQPQLVRLTLENHYVLRF
jgi:hypothetical protein